MEIIDNYFDYFTIFDWGLYLSGLGIMIFAMCSKKLTFTQATISIVLGAFFCAITLQQDARFELLNDKLNTIIEQMEIKNGED